MINNKMINNKHNTTPNNTPSSKHNNKPNVGGKVLASGGFGCVFSPALKCEGSSRRETGKISKLMTERHAFQEYNEILNFKDKLQDIPKYEDYFLLNDFTICKPEKLTKTDLSSFKKTCSALPKIEITAKNINNSLDKLMTLNMPNGGLPVDDYIYKNGSFDKLLELNKHLIDLLKHGIVPMNQRNVYHCDIKDSNVLVQTDEDNNHEIKTRLIDWGLSTEFIPFKNNPLPSTWRNRPLQFNVPFSIIIFTDDFVNKYTDYIEDDGKIDEENLRTFVIDYIHFWLKKRGAGHYKFINDIMYILFSNELTSMNDETKGKIIENDFTMVYITNYIVAVLEHFTRFRKDESLDLRVYLDNVFIEIVDIWGFIVMYFPILDLLFNNYKKLTSNQMEMFELLKYIFVTYLYTPRIEPIKINDLVAQFEELTELFNNELPISSRSSDTGRGIKHKKHKNHTPHKLIRSSKRTTGVTGRTFVPKSIRTFFKKSPKSGTRKIKKWIMLSPKNSRNKGKKLKSNK